jgi:hypothetical protein
MDTASIREALHRQPFEPFRISLVDGRELPVPHPDFVAVHGRRIIVIAQDESCSVVDPRLVAALDYSAPKDKGGNGTPKKKPKP